MILRQLREEDAEAVVGVFQEAFGDARPLDASTIREWFRNPELRPEWLQVAELDGRVVGYADVFLQEDELAIDVASPMAHWDALFGWAEGIGREEGATRARAVLEAGAGLAEWVAARGYRLWRSALTMDLDLLDAPAPGPLPAGLELRPFELAQAEPMRLALNEAFAEDVFFHPATPAAFRAFQLDADGFEASLWHVAWDGDEIAGFSLTTAHRPGEPGLGWIDSLAVRAPWRRRGLGEALLLRSFATFRERGLVRAGLGVDAENPPALALYRGAGMRVVSQRDNWILDL